MNRPGFADDFGGRVLVLLLLVLVLIAGFAGCAGAPADVPAAEPLPWSVTVTAGDVEPSVLELEVQIANLRWSEWLGGRWPLERKPQAPGTFTEVILGGDPPGPIGGVAFLVRGAPGDGGTTTTTSGAPSPYFWRSVELRGDWWAVPLDARDWVLEHEIGHVLGLPDTNDPSCFMHYYNRHDRGFCAAELDHLFGAWGEQRRPPAPARHGPRGER